MGHSRRTRIFGSSKLVALGLLESVVALAYLCAKYSKKLAQVTYSKASFGSNPRRLISCNRSQAEAEEIEPEFEEEIYGDEGLWQRGILMGDKCEPLDFSGVIYYDSNGNRVSELPVKSPCSPLIMGCVNDRTAEK